jgi:hypothetical protein
MGGDSPGGQTDPILQIVVIGFIIGMLLAPFVAFAALVIALAR